MEPTQDVLIQFPLGAGGIIAVVASAIESMQSLQLETAATVVTRSGMQFQTSWAYRIALQTWADALSHNEERIEHDGPAILRALAGGTDNSWADSNGKDDGDQEGSDD